MSRTDWTLSYMFLVNNMFLLSPYFNEESIVSPWDIDSCPVLKFWPVNVKQTFYFNIWVSFKNWTACGYSFYVWKIIWYDCRTGMFLWNHDTIKVQYFLWTHILLSVPFQLILRDIFALTFFTYIMVPTWSKGWTWYFDINSWFGPWFLYALLKSWNFFNWGKLTCT